MARGKRILGAVIEELIGLSTMLIPEPKPKPAQLSLEGFGGDESMDNIQAMKGLLGELRENEAFTSCPGCMAHLDKIEEQLKWAEERIPSYERVVQLKRLMHELPELVKPIQEARPEVKAEAPPPTPPPVKEEETAAECLECALNATLDAKRYLKEAQAADTQERYLQRLIGVKEELQHAQDHLSDKFPELATKVRQLRKTVDPIILKGEMVKPLPIGLSDLESVQGEILSLAHKE